MKLLNNSGPAIFMYSMIVICIIISSVCFGFFYIGKTASQIVLWIGVVAFTIMYHFWVRIIMGNVSKLFAKKVNYNQWWFKEKWFEKNLYEILRVKKWKGKALTYNPEQFDLKTNSLDQIANTMVKSEIDHWINEVLSISTMFFGLIWGETWIFVITALAAMIFDGQFIVIQRYNRPRVLKILERRNKSQKIEENV